MCFIHFAVPIGISPMGIPDRFPQGKPAATELHYPPLTKYCACWVFSCFHNPVNSTRSLTCERNHSYACVYTRGLGTPAVSQHNIFYSEKLTIFLVLLTQVGWVRTSSLWISSPMLYQPSHPVTLRV